MIHLGRWLPLESCTATSNFAKRKIHLLVHIVIGVRRKATSVSQVEKSAPKCVVPVQCAILVREWSFVTSLIVAMLLVVLLRWDEQ